MSKTTDADLAALREKLAKSLRVYMRAHPEARPKSGTAGITWHRVSGKWQVHVWTAGRGVHLGLFRSLGAAEKALSDYRKTLPITPSPSL